MVVISTSCEKESKRKPWYVLYVGACVVDETGEPIQGIYVYPEDTSFPGRDGYTDYKGEMGASAQIKPGQTSTIVFEDVDGDYNGGEYETLRVDISDKMPPASTPDEAGYAGQAFIKLGKVTMKRR